MFCLKNTKGFMKIKLNDKRKQTMRELLGEACQFIDDDNYLPMYRNRQIHFPKEFAKSVELAKKKKVGASRFFATIWSKKRLKESLSILRKMINRAVSKIAKIRHEIAQKKRISNAQKGANQALRQKYLQMRNKTLGDLRFR